jgi:hypothetical protein
MVATLAMTFDPLWRAPLTTQKQGDRQRTPRSPFGLRPKRPRENPAPPRPQKIVATVGAWTASLLASLLTPMLESLLLIPLLVLLTLR